MPKAQTKATDKWQKKVGIISKSFKLKKEIKKFIKFQKNENHTKQFCDIMLVSQE